MQKSSFRGEKATLHQSASHRRRRLTSKERRQFPLLIICSWSSSLLRTRRISLPSSKCRAFIRICCIIHKCHFALWGLIPKYYRRLRKPVIPSRRPSRPPPFRPSSRDRTSSASPRPARARRRRSRCPSSPGWRRTRPASGAAQKFWSSHPRASSWCRSRRTSALTRSICR